MCTACLCSHCESFADDVPLLPSGFRVIQLDPKIDVPAAARTLDLASTLEVGSASVVHPTNEAPSTTYNLRSVLTIAFQFTYGNHLQENTATMARQYARSVVASVQMVATAIAPSPLGSQIGMKHPPGSPGSSKPSTTAQPYSTLSARGIPRATHGRTIAAISQDPQCSCSWEGRHEPTSPSAKHQISLY